MHGYLGIAFLYRCQINANKLPRVISWDRTIPTWPRAGNAYLFPFADYNQYSVNHSTPIQPPPPPPPQQNVRVEVSPSSKPFSQKPKKVAVHEADKYNLNQDVTIQDYDIYDNQVIILFIFFFCLVFYRLFVNCLITGLIRLDLAVDIFTCFRVIICSFNKVLLML